MISIKNNGLNDINSQIVKLFFITYYSKLGGFGTLSFFKTPQKTPKKKLKILKLRKLEQIFKINQPKNLIFNTLKNLQ